jgi:hypothetical protein
MSVRPLAARAVAGHRHFGHPHAWRPGTSRRRFLHHALGAAGLALSSPLWLPSPAHAAASSDAAPRPISSGLRLLGPGTELFHVHLGAGVENATITDFDGVLGVAVLGGMGTGTDTRTGATSRLSFDGTDMRFMQGTYIGADGQKHQGTFGFI